MNIVLVKNKKKRKSKMSLLLLEIWIKLNVNKYLPNLPLDFNGSWRSVENMLIEKIFSIKYLFKSGVNIALLGVDPG